MVVAACFFVGAGTGGFGVALAAGAADGMAAVVAGREGDTTEPVASTDGVF